MRMDATKSIVACFVTRLVLSALFPSLQAQLDKSVEFSTPMTSFRSLCEGVYMLKNGFPLYGGGVVHQSPLLILLMSFVDSEHLLAILYAAMDTVVAYHILALTRYFTQSLQIPLWLPSLLYALNPLVLLSCISRSSVIFTNVCVSSALLCAVQGNVVGSAVAIAGAGYLSAYPILLLIPLCGMGQNRQQKARLIAVTAATLAVLVALSYWATGSSWEFLASTYGSLIRYEKLFPNLGLWWYFFIEMFEMFLPFFKAVFNIFVVSFIAPITIRFNKQPFYAFILCLAWITITKPYPTLGDSGFFLSFIPFFQPLLGYLRYPIISCLLMLHAIFLSPIFYHLWVDLGSGNSNFFYAISLVYALALASIIVDLTWAMLRIEYDEGKPNFNLKLTQI
uniref:GPI transamidase component GAB1 n=1 Tax=Zygotorulaspora mrakii TaxID=42260 RepID=A0A7H9B3D0_ZYGMR|nr:uncharacterized protein HG535_0C06170 [Zygotorulaspora mrakii]QLG72262.1 hypothetical protein HG535_0C06170 [Zygotorulaspora mrakii]